uniref:Uncharacterized protein n=1 Tax=Globodera rostochiensis TaxID=31243 RepID=A0A914I2C3_GLORO
MASMTFKMVSLVLLVLCIGMAIEQSQTYMLGYGYGYGYPYGGWYGKRQAGFGSSAGSGGGNGGTFGNAGGLNDTFHSASSGAGTSSAFEHRIDIPEEIPSFLEQLKSPPVEHKLLIDQGMAIEFLKMFKEMCLILESEDFLILDTAAQIFYISSKIDNKLEEKRQKIGETLFGIVNYFSRDELFDGVGEVNATTTVNRDLFIVRKLCLIGMIMSTAAFINTKILEQALLGHVIWQCVEWVKRTVAQKAACIEQMLDFWTRAKSFLTAGDNINNINDHRRIQSQEVRQLLLVGITPEALNVLVSSRIEIDH